MTEIMVGLNLNFGKCRRAGRHCPGPLTRCLSCSQMASLDTLATDYRTITEACGLLDRSERGKLALTGADARSFLQGQVTNDVEAAARRARLLRRVPDPEGKDARRSPDPRHRRRAPARHRAGRAPGPVQHDPALQHRLRRRAAQAHARARSAVADRARTRRASPEPPAFRRGARARGRSTFPAAVGRASDPDRRRHRPAVRRGRHRRAAIRARGRGRGRRSRRRRSNACGSSAAGPATGSTSTIR